MKRVVTALVLAAIAITAAVARPQIDYDREVDFSKFGSYAWREGTPSGNTLMQDRLERAIDEQLQLRNMSKQQTTADLLLHVHVSSGSEQQVRGSSFGYGGYAGWSGWGRWGSSTSHVSFSDVAVGIVMVDLVDAGTEELVWRAVAGDTIPLNPKKVEKRINKIVTRMFKDFPPTD